jgi:hypothetical protein
MSRSLVLLLAILCLLAEQVIDSRANDPKGAHDNRWGAEQDRPVTLYVFDLAGNGHSFSGLKDGVEFDLDGSGKRGRTGWLSPGSDDVFLMLDGNGDGKVTSAAELLGNRWQAADNNRVRTGLDSLIAIQGFAPDPKPPLPEGLGTIDRADRAYFELRAWNDRNHDGRSDPSELKTLTDLAVNRISLLFRRMPGTPDANGNRSLFKGSFYLDQRGIQVQRQMTEVQFVR